MIQKTLKLRIPEGFKLESIERSLSDNKVLINRIKHKVLSANVLCKYMMNGDKKLLPINLDDDIKIISYNMCEDHILNGVKESENEKYIEFTFQIEGKSEKLYYSDAEAILRGKYDLSQEKLEIDGIDILVSSDKPITRKYDINFNNIITLDIIIPNDISSEEIYNFIKKDKRIQEMMNNFSFVGELEEVKYFAPFFEYFSINLDKVSHNILGIYKDDETSLLKADVILYNKDINLEKAVLVPRILTTRENNKNKLANVITFDLAQISQWR